MKINRLLLAIQLTALSSLSWHSQSVLSHSLNTDRLLDMSLAELLNLEIESASKVAQSAQDIPAHISILNREDIKNYGYVTFVELLRNLPGIYIEEDTEEIYVGTRGSIGGGVLFLVNGVPQHPSLQKSLTLVEANRMNIPVASIDRIEFVRGPMSVIYGNAAFQGTLNIITNNPDKNIAKITAGSEKSGELFLRGVLNGDDAQVTVNLGISQQSGYSGDYNEMLGPSQLPSLTTNSQQTMDGNFEKSLISLDVFAHWHNLNTTLRYQKSDYPIYPTVPPIDDNSLSLETWQSSLQYESELSKHWISRSTLIASQETYDIEQFSFLTPDLNGFQNQESRRWEFEQNFVYSHKENNRLLLGYRYLNLSNIVNDAEILIGNNYILDNDSRLNNFAKQELFTQWQVDLSRRLNTVVGIRYTRLPNSYRQVTDSTQSGNPSQYEKNSVSDRDLVNYRIAFLYSLSDHHKLKLMHGTASQDNESVEFEEPKEIRTTELNHVYEADNWLLSQSLYASETNNIVRRELRFDTQLGLFVNDQVNDGKWKTVGYELYAEVRPTLNWRASLSIDWQKTDDETSSLDIGFSPESLIKLKTDYQLTNNTFAFYAHYVGKRYTDWRFVDTNNDMQVDTEVRNGEAAESYWNLGANWSYSIRENWSIGLNISNLLDEEFRYPANEVSAFERGLIGVGRVMALSSEVTF